MTIAGLKLGHVNIRAVSLEVTVAWYERVLGLRRSVSDTNPDTSMNLWLHDAAGAPCVHVNQMAPGDVRPTNGHIDHFAFDLEDRAGMETRLATLREPYQTVPFPHARMVQLNLRDPNGVKVELTFRNQD